MQNLRPETARFELPRTLIYAVALTGGVLAALAAQIWLATSGYDAGAALQGPISTKSLQLRTAGPWWAIAGAAFIVSGLSAAILNRPLRWRQFGLLRWVVAALVLFGLAHIGH